MLKSIWKIFNVTDSQTEKLTNISDLKSILAIENIHIKSGGPLSFYFGAKSPGICPVQSWSLCKHFYHSDTQNKQKTD